MFFHSASSTLFLFYLMWVDVCVAAIVNPTQNNIMNNQPPAFFLSDTLAGYSRIGAIETYQPHNLYEYMNGGAELYLAYAFEDMAVGYYALDPHKKSDSIYAGTEGDVLVEIFRMKNAEDAYGVYSDDATGEHPDIGQDACYASGFLRFWKGRYFVKVLILIDHNEPRDSILAIGKAIADSILTTGSRPELLRFLPKKLNETFPLIRDRVTYFHTENSLNKIYYVADGNPFLLNAKTEAVFAEYQAQPKPIKVLIIRYDDTRLAQNARDTFEKAYFSESAANPREDSTSFRMETLEDGYAAAITRQENLLIGCFDAESTAMQSIMKQFWDHIHQQKN
ncbi:MAG: hypothetical protein C4527_03255 [Candidatus Omnitrophota bacterium]|nr:MAG: hypothetical protein C4527_03255 [Candidatus Omnitrophota bacterium]